jgi:alkylated DNA repair dioxygenase AlkB
MDKIWLSDNSWYVHCEDFVHCDDNTFEKLWELNDLFEDHEILMNVPDIDILEECMYRLSTYNVFRYRYNALFFNWYKDGNDYISAHRDDEKDLETNSNIASISFGATRTFRIRDYKTKKIVKDFNLTNGSLFIMGGDFQKEFTHEVPNTKECDARRINITCCKFED